MTYSKGHGERAGPAARTESPVTLYRELQACPAVLG